MAEGMGNWCLSGEPITGEGHRHLSLMGGSSPGGVSVDCVRRDGGRRVEGMAVEALGREGQFVYVRG